MATKKKAASKEPSTSVAPVDAAATPKKAKFPAGSRKKKGDDTPVEAVVTAEAPAAEAVVTLAPMEPTHDAIRARAFQIWKERGGSAVANWLQAEAELRGTV